LTILQDVVICDGMPRGMACHLEDRAMSRAWNFIKRMIPPILIIVITVVMSLTAYNDMLKREEEKCWNVLENTADTINNEVIVRFKDNITILKLASNAMVQENRVESYEAITKHINAFQGMTIFSRIDMYYPDDTVLLQTGERIDASAQYSFDEIAAKGEFMSQRMTDILTGNEVVCYSVPVVSKGETIALLVGVIECKAMPDLFKTRAYEGEAFSCIVDCRDGNFIMDDWHDKLGNMYSMKPREKQAEYEGVDLVSDVKEAKTGVIAYESAKNGQASFMYYTPVGAFDWELLIIVQEQVAFASLIKLKSMLVPIGIIEAALLILYFIWTFLTVNQLEKSKRVIEEKRKAFEILSYSDSLTMLYNRNKYNQIVEKYQDKTIESIGVAFLDLNGLKQVNDEFGHKVGDALIQNAARQISLVFQDMGYRIGGDEFVIMAFGMPENEFTEKMQSVKAAMNKQKISISIGEAWQSTDCDLSDLLKDADGRMYQEKRKYYESDESSQYGRGKRYI